MKETPLIPADRKRCQTIIRDGTFMSFGPMTQTRCDRKPTHIVIEKESIRSDGKLGSMSLCDEHLAICLKQLGEKTISVRKIRQ